MVISYGLVGTSEQGLYEEEFPWEDPAEGWILMDYVRPDNFPVSGEWIAQSDGTWLWTNMESAYDVYAYDGDLYGTNPTYGGPDILITATDFGVVSLDDFEASQAAQLADYETKIAVAKSQAEANALAAATALLAAYEAKRPSLVVTTNSSGIFTVNLTSYGYTQAPVVTHSVEAVGGYVVNITAISATSLTGIVQQPRSAILGLLPFQAAGAGLKVHLHIKP